MKDDRLLENDRVHTSASVTGFFARLGRGEPGDFEPYPVAANLFSSTLAAATISLVALASAKSASQVVVRAGLQRGGRLSAQLAEVLLCGGAVDAPLGATLMAISSSPDLAAGGCHPLCRRRVGKPLVGLSDHNGVDIFGHLSPPLRRL